MRVAAFKTKVAVGGFVLLLIIASVALVLLVGDGWPGLTDRKSFRGAFRDASGLQEGAPVKIGGLTVGRVSSLTLQYVEDTPAVVAELLVDQPHAKLVKTDSRAQLATQGVLGDRYIAIVGGTSSAEELADGAMLTVIQPVTFDEVAARANEIVDSFSGALDDVRKFTATLTDVAKGGVLATLADPRNGRRVEAAVDSLVEASNRVGNVARRIDEGHGTLGLLVNDPGLYDDARALLGKSNRSRVARTLVREVVRGANEAATTAPAH